MDGEIRARKNKDWKIIGSRIKYTDTADDIDNVRYIDIDTDVDYSIDTINSYSYQRWVTNLPLGLISF